MSVVDIHCHVFTGKDIPLFGFLRNNGVPNVLVKLVDRVVQGGEPDEALAAAGLGPDEEPSDDVLDDIIRRARAADPELEALIAAELSRLGTEAGFAPLDWFNMARRYVRWSLLLRKDWAAITEKMIDTGRLPHRFGLAGEFFPEALERRYLADDLETGHGARQTYDGDVVLSENAVDLGGDRLSQSLQQCFGAGAGQTERGETLGGVFQLHLAHQDEHGKAFLEGGQQRGGHLHQSVVAALHHAEQG